MPLTKSELTRLRDLREKKHREATGLFVIEGEKVIGELLAEGFPLLEIYATNAWSGLGNTPASTDTKISTITVEEMARASHFPTPSIVIAVGKITRQSLPAGVLNRGLTLALDGIQDPGNVGTLLRLADWFALDRVLMSPDCADLFSQKVINASMGSFARVKIFAGPLPEILMGITVPILGCDLQGTDIHDFPPARDAVIIIGNEGHGLSDAVQSLVTEYITIPKYGGAESLNAATAAAIICDNLRRVTG